MPQGRGCFTGQVKIGGSKQVGSVKINYNLLRFFLSIHSPPELSARIQDERGTGDRFLRIQINSSATKSEPAVVSFLLTVYFKRLKPLISLLRI